MKIVTAGAGSGKTTRVAGEIADAVSGGTPPERIIVTTFTRRAAGELASRVRAHLIEGGRLDAARRIQGSLIGTVNGVCGALLTRFCYELGMPPDSRVVDERESRAMLLEALGHAIPPDTSAHLEELATRFGRNEPAHPSRRTAGWRDDVEKIVALARTNHLDANALRASARRSEREVLSAMDETTTDREAVTAAVMEELARALSAMPEQDQTQATRKARTAIRTDLQTLQSNAAPVPWSRLSSFARLKPGAKSRDAVAALVSAAGQYAACREYGEDLTRYIRLCFEAGIQVLTSFDERKRSRGVIDFIDQEAKLLSALDDPDVAREIRASYDLLVVDEFQDTSPIQLALFTRINRVGVRTVWVGDPKQSIYGFRDADPALMLTIVEHLPDGSRESLPYSYRSRPQLVHFHNAIFSRAFSRTMPHLNVELLPERQEPPDALQAVQLWRYPYDRSRNTDASFCEDLAAGIRQVLDSGELISDTPITAGCVAVLSRTNRHCESIARALTNAGLPVVMEQPALLSTPEAVLLVAVMRLVADPRDTLAAAEIALLTGDHADGGSVLAARLAGGDSWANGEPVLREIEELRTDVSTLSVIAAVDTLIARLSLHRLVARFGNAAQRAANLDRLRRLVADYAELSLRTGTDATLAGAVRAIDALAERGEDSQAIPGGMDAVNVLTYHGAKGLEWPVVVATDLDSSAREAVYATEMVSPEGGIDVAHPLRDRTIRFWPDPGTGADGAPAATLGELSACQVRRDSDRAEHYRLLYVGLTRARDYLVLPVRLKADGSPRWSWLAEAYAEGGDELFLPADAGVHSSIVAGTTGPVEILVRDGIRASAEDSGAARLPAGTVIHRVELPVPARGPGRFAPYVIVPSGNDGDAAAISAPDDAISAPDDAISAPDAAVPGDADAFTAASATGSPLPRRAGAVPQATATTYGTQLFVPPGTDAASLGEAFHVVLGRTVGLEATPAIPEIEAVFSRYGVGDALAAATVVTQAAHFLEWIAASWPGARREIEPSARLARDGRLVRARLDLVVHAETETIVIDHKTLAGSPALSDIVAQHERQLAWYRTIMKAALAEPNRVRTFLHLVLQGQLVEVTW